MGGVVSFSVAFSRHWLSHNNQPCEDTCFIDVEMYDSLINKYKYLHHGANVRILGQLKFVKWQDKDTGKNRTKLLLVADEVELLNDRDREQYEKERKQYKQEREQYKQEREQYEKEQYDLERYEIEKCEQDHYELQENMEADASGVYKQQQLENADWNGGYNQTDQSQNPSTNPYIEIYGPGEEAQTAYNNTH
jgi:single stranded DNA-binding protein